MKNKKERVTDARQLAREYAQTGKYSCGDLIMLKLLDDGHIKAISEFESDSLIESLDRTCEIAKSENETNLRKRFSDWTDFIISNKEELLNRTEVVTDIRSSTLLSYDALRVSGDGYAFEIRRKFNSDTLEHSTYPTNENSFQDVETKKSFDKIDIEDLKQILTQLVAKSIALIEAFSGQQGK